MSKSKLWTVNFLIITIVNFFMFFAFQLFPTALPSYMKSLGAADSVLGWLQGITTIATLMVRPIAGIALDKYGRKGIFILGIIGMILSTSAYFVFPVVSIILIIRFAHGMAWGIANTACSTVASDNIDKKRFAEGMGYFSLASSIAMAVAPAIALSVGMKITIFLALIFLIVTVLLVPRIEYQNHTTTTIIEKKKGSLYAKDAIFPSVIMFFITITWGAVITFLALYGTEKSILSIGLFFTVYAVSMLVTRPFLGKLIDRKGFGAGVWPGVIIIPIALLLLSMSNSLLLFLVCAVLYGIGMGAVQSSLQTMAIMNVSKDKTGAANATFFTGFDGGIGIGAVMAGLLSDVIGYGNMFATMAIFPALAGVIYFINLKRNKAK